MVDSVRSVARLDADTMRVMAHPLRVRIVGDLRVHGPATATILAGRLGESSGATSYHVRVLAEHGFVEEDPDRGTGRERWWRAAQEMTSWRSEDLAGDPEAQAAEEWLLGFQARQATDRIDRWLARRHAADPAWVAAADHSDYWLRMTPDQVTAMMGDVHDVVLRHRRAAMPEGEGGEPAEGTEVVRVFLFAVPEPAGLDYVPDADRRGEPAEPDRGHGRSGDSA
jgi:DNA-binding transcriptional ArsR family regulator